MYKENENSHAEIQSGSRSQLPVHWATLPLDNYECKINTEHET